jgi:hypothetical protein
VALYEALKEHQVARGQADTVAVEECRVLGKRVEGLEVISRPGGMSLSSLAIRNTMLRHHKSPDVVGCLLRGGLTLA